MAAKKTIAQEVLVDLYRRLEVLPSRSSERRKILAQTAELYGVSESTLYRQLRLLYQPNSVKRCDRGKPRTMEQADLEKYCEVIAAFKIRTMNKKGRHISTARAIEVLETVGLDTEYGFLKPSKGLLTRPTINRYLKLWGFDQRHIFQESPAQRFQATHSNECWQFDLSPSDLKHLEQPLWHDRDKNRPILMLYSLIDDRSGVCYQEYRSVYGEDVGEALRFLFNAMSAKSDSNFPFCGIPDCIYTDNGPIAKSRVFKNVLKYLGIELKTHVPDNKDKRRKTARSKGKVERAFRTVKECHEVLYHLREPQNEGEANQRLFEYLKTYNDHPHRQESHSRMEDWQLNLKPGGLREMCTWERFCAFAREPEPRKVGIDARVTVEGTVYELHPDLAGEQVTLWWGLFDDELYTEFEGNRHGPYYPLSGPIPLFRYRKFKKTKNEKRQDKLEALARTLKLPDEFKSEETIETPVDLRRQPFEDPDPFNELQFENKVKARLAVAEYLGKPLALLPQQDIDVIDAILSESSEKAVVMARIKDYFNEKGAHHNAH